MSAQVMRQSEAACIRFNDNEHGHHHNGDRAARRPHVLCSSCVHSLGLYDYSRHKFMSQQMYYQTCSPLTFSSISNRLAATSKVGLFEPLPGLGMGGVEGPR